MKPELPHCYSAESDKKIEARILFVEEALAEYGRRLRILKEEQRRKKGADERSDLDLRFPDLNSPPLPGIER